jgi:prepilin peptidase CpaA
MPVFSLFRRADVKKGVGASVQHAASADAISAVLLIAGLAALVFAGLHDVAVRTVPDWVSLALFGDGLVLRLLDGGRSWLWGLVAALAVLLICATFWRLRWMGGGDVKLLTAAAIFVKPMLVPTLIAGTALTGGLVALVYLAGGALVRRPRSGRPRSWLLRVLRCEQWRLSRRGPLPYAAAIAAGGFIATLHV